MGWNDLLSNETVTGADLKNAVDTLALFKLKKGQTIPNNNEALTKKEASSLVYIKEIDSNELIIKSDFRAVGWRGIGTSCVVEPPTSLNEFDYLVIRYRWAQAAGTDLDTYTGYVNTGTSYDNKFLGYGLGNGTELPPSSSPENALIMWAGDNTNNGVESVLINFKRMTLISEYLTTIPVRMASAWFSSRASGNIDIEVTTYLGGTMYKDGFDIKNSGGTKVQELIFSKNIPKPPGWTSNIETAVPVGYVTYYRTDKTGSIVITY